MVDDGSTDGTQDELARFRGDIRVVKQANRGYAGAMNRCFDEARGDYVAKCDADDIWESDKLERQVEALLIHPEIDIAFSGARFFGLAEGPRALYPEAGVLEPRDSMRRLYRANFVCASSTLVRRSLYQRLGPFDEGRRCARTTTTGCALCRPAPCSSTTRKCSFATGPTSSRSPANMLRMREADYLVHGWHSDLVDDSRLVRKVQARDLSNIARALSDQDRPREARAVFLSSLRRTADAAGAGLGRWSCRPPIDIPPSACRSTGLDQAQTRADPVSGGFAMNVDWRAGAQPELRRHLGHRLGLRSSLLAQCSEETGMTSDSPSGEELRAAAAHGVRWSAIARPTTEVIQLGSIVILARLIVPAEFGRYAIALIAQEVAYLIVAAGLSSALVQRKTIDARAPADRDGPGAARGPRAGGADAGCGQPDRNARSSVRARRCSSG